MKKEYLKTLFDIPKYEILLFLLSCLFVLGGLTVSTIAFTLGITTNWEHYFFRYLGLGSILTAVGAVFANVNFLLMHIRHHKRFYKLESFHKEENEI